MLRQEDNVSPELLGQRKVNVTKIVCMTVLQDIHVCACVCVCVVHDMCVHIPKCTCVCVCVSIHILVCICITERTKLLACFEFSLFDQPCFIKELAVLYLIVFICTVKCSSQFLD